MNAAPTVKGWCPGAHRPMMSGDGLIVRIRPYLAQLDPSQVHGICAAAQRFGSGVIDLTNRANLQIRGVSEQGHAPLLRALNDLGVLDASPELEARRNLLVTPFWRDGDATHRIAADLLGGLARLPALPAKFGFAVDTGPAPVLQDASADIRIERSPDGWIVRADGAARGWPVAEADICAAAVEMAVWFAAQRETDERRMRPVVQRMGVPDAWCRAAPVTPASRPGPGWHPLGALVGAAFGQIDAGDLSRLMETTSATALRVTPWRLFLLEGADATRLAPEDAALGVDACAGAPYCSSASVETRTLARQLAPVIDGTLHVSGCAKGCARRGRADVTLIGRDGRFDLVRIGHAWDAPEKSGLRPDQILAELKTHP